ncbi:MAG: iron ABC transporter permease [Endomicrobiales bacterium]|jgi:iron complex transport system permease protein
MNKILLFLLLLMVLGLSVLLALSLGTVTFSLSEVLRLLFHHSEKSIPATIFWHLRAPRIILAVITGAGLAASGCVFQALLRNPLADSYTLGISGGAALGATIGIVSGLANIHVLFLPLCALCGTMLCIYVVYRLAANNHFSNHTLILSGVILGFICASLVLLLIALTNAEKLYSTLVWLTGDLSSTDPATIVTPFIMTTLGLGVLVLFSRELDVLTLGEEKAAHLGIDPEMMRKLLFIIASLITAACVSVAGVVGFVGLMIPHLMRRISGSSSRTLLISSAIGGAAFLTICDTFARTIIAPVELPVGVITGLVGGITFFVLLVRKTSH